MCHSYVLLCHSYVIMMNPPETNHHSNHYLPTRYVANGEDVKKNSYGERH